MQKLEPVDLYYKDQFSGEILPAPMTRYPDGTPMVKCDGVPSVILCRTPYVAHFMAMLWWVDALRWRGYNHQIDLILPTIIGARQDRLMPPGGDQLFTLKSVSLELCMRGFNSITTIDPHSEVTPALLNRCVTITAADVITRGAAYLAPIRYDAVIAPDAGAAKRAEGVAKLLKKPLVQAWKTRDPATGALSGFGCEPLPPGTQCALLVDDLCDAGGTFLGLAGELRKRQPIALDLYVSHGFFTKGTDALLATFTKVITTDSVIKDHDPRVTVIPVCAEVLK